MCQIGMQNKLLVMNLSAAAVKKRNELIENYFEKLKSITIMRINARDYVMYIIYISCTTNILCDVLLH